MNTSNVHDVGPTYRFEIPHDPAFAAPALTADQLNTEWLLTNGLGGFAMGTVIGCNTRRYHALLIASPNPPLDRRATLAAVHDELVIGGDRYALDNHEFHGEHGASLFNPKGWQCLRRFEKSVVARWTYRVRQLSVVKELRLIWKKQQAVLTYRVEPATGAIRAYDGGGEAVRLAVRPLVAMRDFHHHRRADGDQSFGVDLHEPAAISVTASGQPPLHLAADKGQFTLAREWWYNFRHRVDSERHQDDREDLFSPGFFEHTFEHVGRSVAELRLCFGLEPVDFQACVSDDGRAAHLAKLFEHVRGQLGDAADRRTIEGLVIAADDFVVDRTIVTASAAADASDAHAEGEADAPAPAPRREAMKTILAGYPWFADWGRDTMISLPGLLLATGRFDEALQTLTVFARHIRRGLVPNVFDDYGGEPHYNTVDASLWFVHAALEHRRLAGDQAAWADVLAPACRQVLDAYAAGTDGNIRMDADGLISAGDEHTQLTWMDAKRDGVVFTPRHGKAVEINALWYRALVGCAQAMAGTDKASAARYKKLAALVKKSFPAVFWNDHVEHLNDVVNERGPDGALRPNQVFAVSLPVSPLSAVQQKKVMLAVRQKLLTPVGLRTLAPDHFNYKPRFTGTMFQRDEAYHQGTVWAWLIGPYVEGYLRAFKFSDAARAHGCDALAGLLAELNGNMGQVHEIFDAESPHRPDGAQAQAWSIAELLRALILLETR